MSNAWKENYWPYESPIEQIFGLNVMKYLADGVAINEQVEIATSGGKFRVDFIATGVGMRVGFECDGRDFHDAADDCDRDRLILETGTVDVIFRISGANLCARVAMAILAISKQIPQFFTERSVSILERLAILEGENQGIPPSVVTKRFLHQGKLATELLSASIAHSEKGDNA